MKKWGLIAFIGLGMFALGRFSAIDPLASAD
jgi:hypothetical protein